MPKTPNSFQKTVAIIKFLWNNFDLLEELLPEFKELKSKVYKTAGEVEEINKVIGDVAQLGALISEKTLAETERSLFLSSANEEMLNTLEGVDKAIEDVEALKQGIEVSPAAGSRMIMERNKTLIEINRKLEELYKQRTRVAEASTNGTN